MPDTESVSSVMAVISALDSCAWVVMRRRIRPARYVYQTKSGVMNSDNAVSCHERMSIAIRVLMRMTTLLSSEDAVSVTTD